MRTYKIKVTFNYYDFVVVNAFNEKEAGILAQAEQIKQGKSYEKITSFQRLD
jgi:hypothetical protein